MAFEGYDLKLDFGDASAEAGACRADCALFDFSFLECAQLAGAGAQRAIEVFSGRSLKSLRQNEIFYALRTSPAGEALADLTIWRSGAERFEVMSGRRADAADLAALAGPGVAVTDLTTQRAVFSVQGPRALKVLRKFGDVEAVAALRYFTFTPAQLAGMPCIAGRLGYTGEAGFEIIVERAHAKTLWNALSADIRPAGFVAADMLRIEAGFVLFANEFSLPVSPDEAGLAKFHRPADLRKPEIALVAFRAEADGLTWPWRPARTPQRPREPGTITVTSACASVAAGGILGLGYVPTTTAPAMALRDPSGTFRNIVLAPMPFYDTKKRRPRAPWRS